MQEGRCRVICVNADGDLDDDLDRCRNKNGTQCVPFFMGDENLQYAAAHLIPLNRFKQGSKVAFTKT